MNSISVWVLEENTLQVLNDTIFLQPTYNINKGDRVKKTQK